MWISTEPVEPRHEARDESEAGKRERRGLRGGPTTQAARFADAERTSFTYATKLSNRRFVSQAAS